MSNRTAPRPLDSSCYRVDGLGEPQPLPSAINLTITTARRRAGEAGEARITFFPDGTSSGGVIRLAQGDRAIEIGVTWLTGAIETDWGRR